MNLEELKASWAKDCIIDDDLAKAAMQGPMLHSKYIDELITAKLKHTKIVHEIAELKAIKSRYFRGECTKEELDDRGWPQWQYRTIKSDIPDMIEADPEYQKLLARESYMRTMIYALESIMGEIKNRNWNVRAALDYLKFRSGA